MAQRRWTDSGTAEFFFFLTVNSQGNLFKEQFNSALCTAGKKGPACVRLCGQRNSSLSLFGRSEPTSEDKTSPHSWPCVRTNTVSIWLSGVQHQVSTGLGPAFAEDAATPSVSICGWHSVHSHALLPSPALAGKALDTRRRVLLRQGRPAALPGWRLLPRDHEGVTAAGGPLGDNLVVHMRWGVCVCRSFWEWVWGELCVRFGLRMCCRMRVLCCLCAHVWMRVFCGLRRGMHVGICLCMCFS